MVINARPRHVQRSNFWNSLRRNCDHFQNVQRTYVKVSLGIILDVPIYEKYILGEDMDMG